MNTIVVATDFSPAAQNAVEYTMKAAMAINSKVILFHLYKVSSHAAHSLVGTKAIDEERKMKLLKLQQMAQQYSETYNIEVASAISMGDFMEEVSGVVTHHNAELLVLGMPRKTFEQDLLGNTTTAAIYSLKFPILTIPDTAQFNGIQRILYACDLDRGVHAKILAIVKQYALAYNAEVEVLYVGDSIKKVEAKYQLDEALSGTQFYFKEIVSDAVIKTIQEEAVRYQADIIIMTPHKYGFWASLIHRSKTRALASKGSIPLLSIAY